MRYAMWLAAIAAEFATPLLNIRAARSLPIDRSHIPERFGLFTIIVLGEAVIATATGLGDVAWTPMNLTTAVLGFAMAAAIWWINFAFVEESALVSPTLWRRFAYIYGHFFIVASIVATGIGVEHAFKETAEGHLHTATLALVAGGTAVYLGVITIIRLVGGVCRLVWPRIVAISVLLSLLFVGKFLPPGVVVGLAALLLAGEVWFEARLSPEDEDVEEPAPLLAACRHAGEMVVFEPRSETDGCEECVRNNYKWVHLRLCLSCGHVGCCDSSKYKHATKHFHTTSHPIIASLETGESWAWCYVDERFVPLASER
jgi:hypothetical protein